MMVHAYNPSYVGGVNMRIVVRGGPWGNSKVLSEK
jgi:hypothetical protein